MRCCLLVLVACGNSPHSPGDAPPSHDSGMADATMHVDDGTPTRVACTGNFGTALSSTPTFGRLDGFLVAIVPPGGGGCNADSSHVHLQVKMNNEVYDVAVDVTDGQTGIDDVHSATRDIALPGHVAWAEGWHTGILDDYIADGVHAPDLPLMTKAELTAALMSDLASANHISIYATTYGRTGTHLVHRNGSGHDGLIVTEPLSAPVHARFLSFTNQAF